MKLVGSKTISLYARKVRVMLAEKELAYEFVEESAWTADTTGAALQPAQQGAGAGDGRRRHRLYDSAVIAEYLDGVSRRRA